MALRQACVFARSTQRRSHLTHYSHFPQQLIHRREFTEEHTPGESTIQSDSFSWAQTRDASFRQRYNPSNIGGEKAGDSEYSM